MFRNNFGSKTQTQTQAQTQTQTQTQTQIQAQNNLFGGTYNTVGSNSNIINSDSDDGIIYAIVTGNLVNVKKLVNSININKIIDKKNNFTALHHAVRIKKNDVIVEYLLKCGANPDLKQDEGKDAVDLSIESNYRYLIDKMLKDKEVELDSLYTKFDDVNYKVKTLDRTNKELEKTNKELEKTNEYLKKSTEQYVNKIDELKTENVSLKRKLDDSDKKLVESEKAFSNLLKKTKK